MCGLDIREWYMKIMRLCRGEDYGKWRIACWDGGYDKYGRFYKHSVWDKIARFLEERRCQDVVGFLLANILVGRTYPNQYITEAAWSTYRTWLESNQQRNRTDAAIFVKNVLYWWQYIPLREAVRYVCSDPALGLSDPFKDQIVEFFRCRGLL